MNLPQWREIIVHHGALPDTDQGEAEKIRAFHTAPPPRGRGWRDTGYHWLCERVGNRYHAVPGRPLTLPGAHCPGHNRTAIGVCLVGDFSDAPPPQAQIECASELIARLCREWNISPVHIHAHREFRATECPGRAFDMAPLSEAVSRHLEFG